MRKILIALMVVMALAMIPSCDLSWVDEWNESVEEANKPNWGLKINSYETVDSYRISLGTVTSTIKPDNGNCFLEVNVTLTNLQEEAGRFDISVTDTVELFINSGAVGIYEDKSSYYPPQAERIASNDSVNLVWYFEIPENTDLSEAYIKIIPMFAGSTIAYFK